MSSTPMRSAAVNGFARAPNGSHLTARRGPSVGRDARPTSVHRASTVAASVAEDEREDDPIHKSLTARWEENQAAINALFSGDGILRRDHQQPTDATALSRRDREESANPAVPRVRPARVLDEDYGDDDDEDEEDEDEDDVDKQSPLKSKGRPDAPNGLLLHPVRAPPPLITRNSTSRLGAPPATEQAKSTEEVRKQLEEDKKAAAEAAKQSFQGMFFTLENDHDAMLEQQKLDELDREVENEMSGDANAQGVTSAGNSGANANGNPNQGSLGSSDLGASSLTLKHLIARIDMSRTMVKASDHQLRTLITEVRKGRSKWASEDKVGQEELYEACEKVLMELKAMTEYAQPFLQRVSKREAPDYFNVIKHPMDIGTMIKKLKQMLYKSKKDFVDDVNLIWANCLKYNQEPSHPLRKKALYMRKETDKLTPLIPDIVVRDRAEIEAEERRLASMGGDDSDDDDAPIMASRGRKAPKKGISSTGRKAPDGPSTDGAEAAVDSKPGVHHSASSIRGDFLRADSEMVDATSVGTGTPPPGFATPAMNGINGIHAPGSHSDLQEVDSLGQVLVTTHVDDLDEEDTEFKTWKQVTKRDRAQAAAERNRLFRGDQLNLDEPALLRTRAMMRRWTRQQRAAEKVTTDSTIEDEFENAEPIAGGESLAEGIETEQDSSLPDYYNPLNAIPDLDNRWKWTVDSEGGVIPQADEWMRMYPRNQYVSVSDGSLSKRMEANMKQMQDTRQICAKIGIVKQMQLQAQTYTNQFQKYEPQKFLEQDVGPVVVSESGPLLAPWLNRAAFQRGVAKIFYHAGFEDFQPSALDAVTDLASDFLTRVIGTYKLYHEQPKREVLTADDKATKSFSAATMDIDTPTLLAPRHTLEERVLHTLDENGMDLDGLESYVRDDVERLGSKLGVMHERMKSHLADLFRPALGDHAGADGAGAFNDGSEQFVGGDFAEDLGEDFFGFRELGLADEFGLESLSVPLHLLQNRMHLAYQAQHNLGAAGAAGASGGLIFPLPEAYAPLTKERIDGEIGLVRDFFRVRLARTTGGGGIAISSAAAAAAATERAAAAAAAAAAANTNGDGMAAAPAAILAGPPQPALIEDEDLPQKQRFPKPRLPPTGKISSPRKRPLREQQQAAKKKRKLEEEGKQLLLNGGGRADVTKTVGPLKLVPTSGNAGVKDRSVAEKGEGKGGDRSLMMDSSLGNKSKRDGGGGGAEDEIGEKDGADVNGPMSPESISG